MTDASEPETDLPENTAEASGARSTGSAGPDRPYAQRTTVIARTVVRLAVPIILVTGIALLLQGHNRPGGGFIGGVLTTSAFVLVYVVFGLEFLESELFDVDAEAGEYHHAVELYRLVFAGGLALAFAAGLVPVLAGLPFLTQGVLFLEHLPLFGELEVASAFAFDFGIYLAVVGSLLTVIGEVGSE